MLSEDRVSFEVLVHCSVLQENCKCPSVMNSKGKQIQVDVFSTAHLEH